MMKLRPSVLLLVLVLVAGATSDQDQENQNPSLPPRLHVVPLEAQSSNESSDVCVLPAVVGPCRAALPRFYYNATDQSCYGFIYGGCSANGNNFQTVEECEDRCAEVTDPPSVKEARVASTDSSDSADSAPLQRSEKSTEPTNELCGAEPVAGPCRAAFQRWFFNPSTGRCHTFIYGGCQGNQNNHESEESCSASCSGTTPPSAKMTGNDQQAENDVCAMTSDSGPCRAAFPMFYYDVQTHSCVSFIYGGCRGNDNRFSSEEQCLTRCHGKGQSDEQDQSRNHWTAAVFLFVSLAVISFLVLSAIIIVSLRRRRMTHRSSSVSDKEELLPDDQTSVDSFSLPDTSSPPPPPKA